MRSNLAVILCAIALAYTQNAVAGEFETSLVGVADDDIGDAKLAFESTQASIEPGGGDSAFSFTMTDPLDTSARTTVTVEDLPDGMAQFSLRLNIPFHWTLEDDNARIAAAVVRDTLGPSTVRDIVRSADQGVGSVEARVLLNQRARVALGKLLKQARALNADDARMAFVFVQTSKELGFLNFVQPDSKMEEAVQLLKTMLGTQSLVDRVLPNLDDRKNVQSVIDDFGQIQATQMQIIVHAVSRQMSGASAAERSLACGRALALNDVLSNLTEDDRPALDPNWRRTVQNLTNVLICRWRDMSWNAGTRPDDADERIENARIAVEQMQSSLAMYQEVNGAEQGVITRARDRVDEVEARIAMQTN